MANYLILNQNQVFNGLGTLTYSVTTTGQYNVQVQTTFQQAYPTGSGSGSGQGLGSGTGGGGEGFTGGDLGTGHGGVGQGFGASNGYQQPSAQGSNQSQGAAVSSGLSVVVNKNGSAIYTSTVPLGLGQSSPSSPAFAQSALQFKTGFAASNGDSITVVFSSSTLSDEGLSGLTSNVSIAQGLM